MKEGTLGEGVNKCWLSLLLHGRLHLLVYLLKVKFVKEFIKSAHC